MPSAGSAWQGSCAFQAKGVSSLRCCCSQSNLRQADLAAVALHRDSKGCPRHPVQAVVYAHSSGVRRPPSAPAGWSAQAELTSQCPRGWTGRQGQPAASGGPTCFAGCPSGQSAARQWQPDWGTPLKAPAPWASLVQEQRGSPTGTNTSACEGPGAYLIPQPGDVVQVELDVVHFRPIFQAQHVLRLGHLHMTG
jgi:hypothetical protein